MANTSHTLASITPGIDPIGEDSDQCVLLVEDDEIMRLSLEDRLRLEGLSVRIAGDIAAAHGQLEKGDIDLVVTDIRLPDGSGADLFHDISRRHPGIPVILMTAYGTVADAVSLVKAGALDYLTKPFAISDLIDKIQRNLARLRQARLSAESLGMPGQTFHPGAGVMGKSKSMRRIERLVARLTEVDSSVLITGESGVGKEVLAGLIHHNSRRAGKNLVAVNCAALPANLVESELFGHEKGAFTGATQRHIGRFEQANGGTIFLDEIAEIPPEVQVKLLRVLQEQVVDRVGGERPIPLDVRIIAATQVDMDEAVRDGRFRSDLFWRLNVIHVAIPPLRDRQDDIPYLASLFVAEHAARMDKSVRGVSREAEAYLSSLSFHGNVRELRNLLERAVALCDGCRIEKHDLLPIDGGAEMPFGDGDTEPHTLKDVVINAERCAIQEALSRHHGAVGKAAEELGISRKNLWEKMRRYQIEH